MNTYACPAATGGRKGELTTAKFLSMSTALPNRSPAPPSLATSLACWVQVAPERVNTYAAPAAAASPTC
jgi:hypothetical protein